MRRHLVIMLRTIASAVLLLFAASLQAQQIDLEKIFEEKNLGPVGGLLAKGDSELVARSGEAAAGKGEGNRTSFASGTPAERRKTSASRTVALMRSTD